MNLYEHLPHEWNYAYFLADHYDLHPYDSMIHNNLDGTYLVAEFRIIRIFFLCELEV